MNRFPVEGSHGIIGERKCKKIPFQVQKIVLKYSPCFALYILFTYVRRQSSIGGHKEALP
jgi:hypothetical protein